MRFSYETVEEILGGQLVKTLCLYSNSLVKHGYSLVITVPRRFDEPDYCCKMENFVLMNFVDLVSK